MKKSIAAVLVLLLGVGACSGGGETGGDGDGATGDGDGDIGGDGDGDGDGDTSGSGGAGQGDGGSPSEGTGGDDGEPAPSGKCAPDAVTTADGILTAYPDMQLTISEGWEILSAHPVLRPTPSGDPYTNIYFEVENTGAETMCNIFPEASLNGIPDALIQAEAAPYKSESSNLTQPCVAPGDITILWITDIDLVEEDIDTLPVDIEMYATTNSSFSPALPQVSQTVTGDSFPVEEGDYGITGDVTFNTNLYNYAFTAFAKDSQGLIVADFSAYPDSGASFLAGQSVSYEASLVFENDCDFTSFVYFDSWIEED